MKHTPQYDRAWLDSASPAEIVRAQAAGELSDVLAGRDPGVENQRRQFEAEAADARAELAKLPKPPAPTPAQGANADSASPDIGGQTWREAERAKLRQMSPAEVVAAHNRGDLDALLNINPERTA